MPLSLGPLKSWSSNGHHHYVWQTGSLANDDNMTVTLPHENLCHFYISVRRGAHKISFPGWLTLRDLKGNIFFMKYITDVIEFLLEIINFYSPSFRDGKRLGLSVFVTLLIG